MSSRQSIPWLIVLSGYISRKLSIFGTDTINPSPVTCPVQSVALDRGPSWNPGATQESRLQAYERLAQAVRIPTETFDDLPLDPSGPRFDSFDRFEAYIRGAFALFLENVVFEKVNTHGLLFTWKGSHPDRRPIILMGHQDVVPVDPSTLDQWTYPPFSAHMDSEGWVWGRGTTDMKSTVVALLTAAEQLIKESFKPDRDIVYSFGFDEEIGGQRGAKRLAEVLLTRYGKDGAAMVVDEGFTGVDWEYGQKFARVGLAEKGCLTLQLTVKTPGGHSSAPPRHTGIGIMARLLVELEDHPALPKLEEGNPLLTYLTCASQHGHMSERRIRQVQEKRLWPELALELDDDRSLEVFMKTTQGGAKFNALPETVQSLINYRIDFFESSEMVMDRVANLLRPIAQSINMTFSVDSGGQEHDTQPLNSVRLGPAFELFAGTIKHQFPGSVVVPSAMTAFTDTQYYWDVTPNIYRFLPASLNEVKNYHTVDERIHLDAHLSTMAFFYKLLQNSQGWDMH